MSSAIFSAPFWVSSWQSVGICLLLFSGAFGAGKLIFFRRNVPLLPVFAAGVWITAVLGLTGNIWLARSWGQRGIFFIWCLLGVYGIWKFLPALRRHPALTTGCAAMLLLTAASALLPPWNWDEQVYQVALPMHYLFSGSVAVLPDNPYSAYPSLAHFFELPLLAYGGAALPRLAVWGLFCVLGAWGFNRLSRCGKLIGAVLFAAGGLSPLSSGLNQAAYAEIFILLFAAAGAEALADPEKRDAVWLAGFSGGAALAVKLTGAVVPLMLFVYLLMQKELRRKWLFFCTAVFLAAAPFFLRVALCCGGNPFYPYFSRWFGSPAAALVEEYHHLLGSARYGLGPLTGTVFGWLFTALRPQLYDGMGTGWQFPALWLFLAGVFWYLVRSGEWGKKRWHAMLLALAAGYLFWGFTAQQSRFLYVELVFLLFPAGLAAKELLSTAGRKIFVLLLLLLTLFSISPGRLLHYRTAWKLLAPAQRDPENFLLHAGRDTGYVSLLKQLSSPEINGRVALLWERRTLYLPRNGKSYTICHPRFQEKLTPPPLTPEALYQALKDFDYVAVSFPERDVDRQEDFAEENRFLMQNFFQLVRAGYFSTQGPGLLFRRNTSAH